MATEPLNDPDHQESFVDQSHDVHETLVERCARAEQQVEDLQAELARVTKRLADLEASAASPISILDSADAGATGSGLARDGSDPRLLSMALAATSVVAAMVAFLAFLNDNLFTTFGLAMLLVTVVLAVAAARTRVQPVHVTMTRGVVYIDKGDTSYRFDIRNAGTAVQMVGEPGDPGWQVRFRRKGMEDFVLDRDLVDPHDFTRRLREHRPDL